jgi:TolB-like protein/AraC-like DNA-binding protein
MGSPQSMEDQFLERLSDIVETHLSDEQFGVKELAEKLNFNRVTFHRKVKSLTGKSVSKYLRDFRLQKARELLRNHTGTVSEIAYEVGFSSPAYFVKCYHDYFGYPPGQEFNLAKETEKSTIPIPSKRLKLKWQRKSLRILVPVILIVPIILFIVTKPLSKPKPVNRTIAVLPFIDDSPDSSNSYVIEGMREEIKNKLILIGDLAVVSRTSTEKYRRTDKTIKEIGQELKVRYILEASAQTIAGRIRIRFQLIDAVTDRHLWSKSFERELSLDNLFGIQQELALSVANELQAKLKPEEKKRITDRSTENPAAYNYYLKGLDYLNLYSRDKNPSFYLSAKKEFENAVRLDSTFADAYCRLAGIYIHQLAFTYDHRNFNLYNLYLDSGLMMSEKAIMNGIADINQVYQYKVDYYQRKERNEEAIKYFEKLWKDKEKDYTYYLSKANFHVWSYEPSEVVRNLFTYFENKPDSVQVNIDALERMSVVLTRTGYPVLAEKYAQLTFLQHHDSLRYQKLRIFIDYHSGNFEGAIEKNKALHFKDTTNLSYLSALMFLYLHLRDYNSAYFWARKYERIEIRETGRLKPDAFKGNIYLLRGMEKEAEWNFKGAIGLCKEQIKYNNFSAQHSKMVYGLLSAIYSMQGLKEESLANFKVMSSLKVVPILVIAQIKVLPAYDFIRAEPEFIEMLKKMEKAYLSEHEKVRKILISRGLEPE